MLRKSIFAMSALLVLGSVAACGDDDDDKKNNPDTGESCDENPDQDKCDSNTDETCEENPDQEKCEDELPEVEFDLDDASFSAVTGLQFPSKSGEDQCCVDYTGDSELNNGLIGILELLKNPTVVDMIGDFDLDELIDDLFEDGDLNLVFALDGDISDPSKNEDLQAQLWLADTESSLEDRQANEGEFVLTDKIADIPEAKLGRDEINAEISTLPLSLDVGGLIDDDEINIGTIALPLSNVDFRVDAFKNDNGLGNGAPDIAITDSNGEPTNYLSGVLKGEEVADLVNDIIGDQLCNGSGYDKDNPILIIKDEPSEDDPELPIIEITDDEDLAENLEKGDAEFCGEIAGYLNIVVGLVGTIFDVDSSDNGVNDALSLGLRVELNGAKASK